MYALFMDAEEHDQRLSEATWRLDLSDSVYPTLSFQMWRGNEAWNFLPRQFTGHYNGDGISISDDGVNWHKLLDDRGYPKNAWTLCEISLGRIARETGVSLDGEIRIKFQRYGTNTVWRNYGIAWDNIRITDVSDWYGVDLNAGDLVTAVSADLDKADTDITIFDDSGAQLAGGDSTAKNVSSMVSGFTPPADGTYYIRVAGIPEARYSLMVIQGAAFEAELNNTPADAHDMSVAGTVLGDIRGQGGLGAIFCVWEDNEGYLHKLDPLTGNVLSQRWASVSGDENSAMTGTDETILLAGRYVIQEFDAASLDLIREIPDFRPYDYNRYTTTMACLDGVLYMRDNLYSNLYAVDYATGDLLATVSLEKRFHALAAAENRLIGLYYSSVYEIDPATGNAVLLGNLEVDGRDLAFADGELYVSAADTVYVYDLATLALQRTIITPAGYDEIMALEVAPGFADDFYSVPVGAGEILTVATFTPAGGPGLFANNLDPIIELYNPAGVLIDSDDNSAADRRNAHLTYMSVQSGTYVIKILAANNTSGEYVLNAEFPPPPEKPVLVALAATDITAHTVTLNGEILDTGGLASNVHVVWGDNDAGAAGIEAWDHAVDLGARGLGQFSTNITGLDPVSTYYFRFVASHFGGTSWTDPAGSFVTAAAPAGVALRPETGISSSSATLNAEVVSTGGEDPHVYFVWGADPDAWDHEVDMGIQGLGLLNTTLTGLSRMTQYYWSVYAANSAGVSWAGPAEAFTTLPDAPELSTQPVTNVTAHTAILNGQILDTGGQDVRLYAAWGDNDAGATVLGTWDHYADLGIRSDGAFSTTIGSLAPTSTYYFRFFADNSGGGTWTDPAGSFTSTAEPATVTLRPVSGISSSSATLNAEVISTGGEDPRVYFVWGADNEGTDAGAWDHEVDLGVHGHGVLSTTLTGLSRMTQYYWSAYATNDAGISWAGAATAFTTLPEAPALSVQPATGITADTATLNGQILDTGGQDVHLYAVWGDEDTGRISLGAWDHFVNLGMHGAGAVSMNVVNLDPVSTYYFRFFATNSGGATWTDPAGSFTTTANAATVTLRQASGVSPFSATLGAEVTSTGGEDPRVYFVWGADNQGADPDAWDHEVDMGIRGTGPLNTTLSGLSRMTQYYWSLYAVNSGGLSWAGPAAMFVTLPEAPSLAAQPAGDVTAYAATLNGQVLDTGGSDARVFAVWGDNDAGTGGLGTWDHTVDLGILGDGAFSTEIVSLDPASTYYCRFYAANAGGSTWTDPVISFAAAGPESASISGRKFRDANVDGLPTAGEEGLDGWTIELVDPDTGAVLATAVTVSVDLDGGGIDPTTESGLYSFDRIAPGDYELREVMESGWIQTYPAALVHSLTVAGGQVERGVDFGNARYGSISGQKFEDLDGDAQRDPGEPGLDGWTIELLDPETATVIATTLTESIDLDGSGAIDPITEQGLYSFTDLSPLPGTGAPAAVIVDNADAGFRVSSSRRWSRLSGVPGAYGGTCRTTGMPGRYAWWVLDDLPTGSYEVSVTWAVPTVGGQPLDTAPNAPFRVYDGGSLGGSAYTPGTLVGSQTVDQTAAPDDEPDNGTWWESLGEFDITQGRMVIELEGVPEAGDGTTLFVVADAVRVLGQAPNYIVREAHETGWTQTFPEDEVHTILLREGHSFEGADFGNYNPTPGSLPDAIPDVPAEPAVLPGDVDGDGVVGVADMAILQGDFGQTESGGPLRSDINSDGSVDIRDFMILRANFGSTMSPSTAALSAVPQDAVLAAAENTDSGGSILIPAVTIPVASTPEPPVDLLALSLSIKLVESSWADSYPSEPQPTAAVSAATILYRAAAAEDDLRTLGDDLLADSIGNTSDGLYIPVVTDDPLPDLIAESSIAIPL